MNNLLKKLKHVLLQLGARQARAAHVILKVPQAVAIETMRALAVRAGISPPAMPRLGIGLLDETAYVGAGGVVLAVAAAPHARDIVTICREAAKNGATRALVTDGAATPLWSEAAAHVAVGTQSSPHYSPSTVGLIAALEIPSALVCVKRGADGLHTVAVGEARLRASHRYMDQGT